MRETVDQNHIDQMTEALQGDGILEGRPAVVFHEGTTYWLADGYQRKPAYGAAGMEMPCVVFEGGFEDARLYAATEANSRHGLRLKGEETAKALKVVNTHPKTKHLTMAEKARLVGCSRRQASRILSAHGAPMPTMREVPEGLTEEEQEKWKAILASGGIARALNPQWKNFIQNVAQKKEPEDWRVTVSIAGRAWNSTPNSTRE